MQVATPDILSLDLQTDPRYNPNGKTSPGVVIVGSALYIAIDQTVHGFDVLRSTDNGASWTWMDEVGANLRASGRPVYYGEGCCYGGGKFHFVWFDAYTETMWYHAFDTATNLWETSVDLELAAYQDDATNVSVKAIYRSDGSIVFTYHPDAYYLANFGIIEAGVLTDSGIEIDAAIIMIDQLLVDPNDRIHILFENGLWYTLPNRYLRHKSWDGSTFSATTTPIDSLRAHPYGSIYNRVGKAMIRDGKIIIPFAKETTYWSYPSVAYNSYTETFPSNCVMAVVYSDALTSPVWTTVEVTDNTDGEEKRPDVVIASSNWYTSAVIYCEDRYQVIWSSEFLFHSYYPLSDPDLPRFYNKFYRARSEDLATWTDPDEILTSTFFSDTTFAAEPPHTYDSGWHYPVHSPVTSDGTTLSMGVLLAFNGPLMSGPISWPAGGPFGFSIGSFVEFTDEEVNLEGVSNGVATVTGTLEVGGIPEPWEPGLGGNNGVMLVISV